MHREPPCLWSPPGHAGRAVFMKLERLPASGAGGGGGSGCHARAGINMSADSRCSGIINRCLHLY